MRKLYDLWTSYALAVVEIFFGYTKLTEDWPWPLSMGLLVAPAVLAKVFLPVWVPVALFMAVGLPLVWFLVTMIVTYYDN